MSREKRFFPVEISEHFKQLAVATLQSLGAVATMGGGPMLQAVRTMSAEQRERANNEARAAHEIDEIVADAAKRIPDFPPNWL